MSNVRPIPVGAIASRLLLQTLTDKTPLTQQARTAGPRDIEHMREQFTLLTDLYISAVHEHVKKLNENLPMGDTIRLRDFDACLADARSEIVGQMNAQAERDR